MLYLQTGARHIACLGSDVSCQWSVVRGQGSRARGHGTVDSFHIVNSYVLSQAS